MNLSRRSVVAGRSGRRARHPDVVRVALIAETALLHMNGVTGSLRYVLRHLESAGHEARVIAPRAGGGEAGDRQVHGAPVELLRSMPLPSYPDVRLVVARARRLADSLAAFGPDVVHLASPFVLGWQALRAAELLGVPTVAVYQTDIPGYARRYGLAAAEPGLTAHLARVHRRATLTLAPSSAAMADLARLGVDRLRLWGRGVDTARFRPDRRSSALRRRLAPNGEVLVGYVGRLAPEKQLADLRVLADLPGIRLVVIGDGPDRAALERLLPRAVFTGFQNGDRLAESMASLDLFVHPGEEETFCQAIQEAMASGVPVVATGAGGPLDLVDSSRTGWLYRPGDLADLRARVADLAGDDGKRRAFGAAARAAVAGRTWDRLGDELLVHYADAIGAGSRARRVPVRAPSSGSHPVRSSPRLPREPEDPRPAPRWARYVAVGDSITEGLCDSSRQAPGAYRGWADRLAMLLAHAGTPTAPLGYANLAVRSRRIRDVVDEQIPAALTLAPDLVTVLIGGNDLARVDADPARLAAGLARGIRRLRCSGPDVLLVAPVIPPAPFLRPLHRRTRLYAARLAEIADATGAVLLDLSGDPEMLDPRLWAEDRVHLGSRGHRLLAYRAAALLGVPAADQLGALDSSMHDDEEAEGMPLRTGEWLRRHVAPWASRRVRGITAGDGLVAKHDALVPIGPYGSAGAALLPRPTQA